MQNADMHARLFSAAADLASGRWLSEPGLADPALQLLRSLDLVPEDGEAADLRLDLVPNAAALLRAAARLSVLFRLPAPDMPGLVFVGGEADPRRLGLAAEEGAAASLAGAALDHPAAFAACTGFMAGKRRRRPQAPLSHGRAMARSLFRRHLGHRIVGMLGPVGVFGRHGPARALVDRAHR